MAEMRRRESEDVIINQKQAGKSSDQRRRSPRYIRHSARPTFAMWYRRTRDISCPIHRTERRLSGTPTGIITASAQEREKRGAQPMKRRRSAPELGPERHGSCKHSAPGAQVLGISLVSPWQALGLIDMHG